MKYLANLLNSSEILDEKRIPSELYGRLLGDMQRLMVLCHAITSYGCASQSEIVLVYCALNYTSEHNGENITVAQAAKHLGAQMSSVSRTLRSLTQKGYVERYSDLNDRRTVRIKVTQAGENELKKVLRHIFSLIDKAMCDFSDEEIKMMIELHGRFVNAISNAVLSERRTDKCLRSKT